MLTSGRPHIEASLLSAYITGALREPDIATVEEHLLLCESCRQRLDEQEHDYVAREAARRIRAREKSRPEFKRFQKASAWTALIAASIALVIFVTPRITPAPYIDIQLQSARGPGGGITTATAGRPLRLHINVSQLSVQPRFHVEIADARGGVVWQSTPQLSNSQLIAPVDKKLSRGGYWVRLYGAQSQLLREFGLRLE